MKPTIDISTDKSELDHRLHFHVVTEHFTHNNEQIKLHFRVIKRKKNTLFIISFSSSVSLFVQQQVNILLLKQFLQIMAFIYFNMKRMFNSKFSQLIICLFSSNTDIESEYILVGKDLLTNVLML